jgi:hypothetical protein
MAQFPAKLAIHWLGRLLVSDQILDLRDELR